jgi:hypothetical protein
MTDITAMHAGTATGNTDAYIAKPKQTATVPSGDIIAAQKAGLMSHTLQGR